MFQTDRPISLANAEKNFSILVHGGYYTALSDDVIYDVCVYIYKQKLKCLVWYFWSRRDV